MRLLSIAALAVFFPSAAAAQNSGIFVQAGPLLDVRFDSSYAVGGATASLVGIGVIGGVGGGPPADEQTRTTRERFGPGGSAAIGAFVSPAVSLRVETSFHARHTRTSETSSASERTSSRSEDTTGVTDISIAAAWHKDLGRRTSISYIGGIVFRRQKLEGLSRFTYQDIGLVVRDGRLVQALVDQTNEETYESTYYDRGVLAGIDITVNLTEQFALVPQVRLVAATGSWNLRPAVSLRWRH